MRDEKLILYYYDDGLTRQEKIEVEVALKSDPELAALYRTLRRELAGLVEDDAPAVPTHVVQRWHDSIDAAAQKEANANRRQGSGFSLPSFFWGAAVTASLAVGVGIGVYLTISSTNEPSMRVGVFEAPPNEIDMIPRVANSSTAIPNALNRGLQVHLRDSRRDITTLSLQPEAERVLMIMQILQQNRLYLQAAERKNSPDIARVLRAFEPILVRLAAEDISAEDVELLREQLAFELNVMLTKLARQTSEPAQTI
jgi:hypothetical protein